VCCFHLGQRGQAHWDLRLAQDVVCAPLWRKSRQEAEVLSDWCRLMMYGGNADPDLFENGFPVNKVSRVMALDMLAGPRERTCSSWWTHTLHACRC
jgi:hypothetical protein